MPLAAEPTLLLLQCCLEEKEEEGAALERPPLLCSLPAWLHWLRCWCSQLLCCC